MYQNNKIAQIKNVSNFNIRMAKKININHVKWTVKVTFKLLFFFEQENSIKFGSKLFLVFAQHQTNVAMKQWSLNKTNH